MRRQFGHDGPLTPHQVGPRPTCLVQLPRMRQTRGWFSGIGPSEQLPRIAVVSTVIRLQCHVVKPLAHVPTGRRGALGTWRAARD